jgi:predicted hydrocarbon binding protein
MVTNRDIRIPADSILATRRALQREVGPEAAGRALQEAGYSAGDAIYERLRRTTDDDALADTPSSAFWDLLSSIFREMGWGAMRHEEVHQGVGGLVATDWFEVEPDVDRPRCPFTTGVLANLLGRLADGDVAVMQVPCDEGQAGCARFLFGSQHVLDELYSGLRSGRDLAASLSSLG